MVDAEDSAPRRRPLDRAEAQRWQLQAFANRHPSEKELEIRQGLAAMLDLQDLRDEYDRTHPSGSPPADDD